MSNADFRLKVIFDGVDNTNQAVSGIKGHLNELKGAFTDFGNQARGLFNFQNMLVAGGVGYAAKTIFEEAAKLDQTRVSMKVMLRGDEKSANLLIEDWKALGAKTNLENEDVFNVGKMMLRFNAVNKENVTQFSAMLADLAGSAENPSEAFKGMGYAFSQVMSLGRLQGNDLLQFINAGFNPLAEMLAMVREGIAPISEMKENLSSFQKMDDQHLMAYFTKLKEQGKISSDAVVASMQHATGKGGMFYGMQDQLADHPMGRYSTMISDFKTGIADLGTEMMPIFTRYMEIAIEGIKDLREWIKANGDTIRDFVSVGIEALKIFALFKGVSLSLSFANGMRDSIIAVGGLSKVLLGNLIPSLASATVAQGGLNLAVLANPYVAVAAGVAALTYGVYRFIDANREARTSAELLQDANQRASEQVANDVATLDAYKILLNKTNANTAERARLVNELKSKYPDYISSLNLEKASLGDISNSLEDVKQKMQDLALERAKMELLTDLNKNIIAKEMEVARDTAEYNTAGAMKQLWIDFRESQKAWGGEATWQDQASIERMKKERDAMAVNITQNINVQGKMDETAKQDLQSNLKISADEVAMVINDRRRYGSN
jgi:hypothetical protein